MVRYNPLVAVLYSILIAQRAKRNPYLSRFRRKRIEFLSPFTQPPPILPLWLSRSLDSLRLQYPEDRFHVLKGVKTIYESDQCIGTVDPNLPYAHGPKWKLIHQISCDDCGEKVTFQQRDKSDVERFEIHLQTPAHRQFVEARKASRINTEPSITSVDSELNQTPRLQPSSRSDVWDSPSGESVIPNKDPTSHFLQRSSSSFQPAPDERMEDYPLDQNYPEKTEADLDEVARSSSKSDSEVFVVPEGDDFEDSIYGREHFDRVKNDRKRDAPSSSENANSCGKGRPGKRRRGTM
jgi:hypothetical protein